MYNKFEFLPICGPLEILGTVLRKRLPTTIRQHCESVRNRKCRIARAWVNTKYGIARVSANANCGIAIASVNTKCGIAIASVNAKCGIAIASVNTKCGNARANVNNKCSTVLRERPSTPNTAQSDGCSAYETITTALGCQEVGPPHLWEGVRPRLHRSKLKCEVICQTWSNCYALLITTAWKKIVLVLWGIVTDMNAVLCSPEEQYFGIDKDYQRWIVRTLMFANVMRLINSRNYSTSLYEVFTGGYDVQLWRHTNLKITYI